MKKMALFVFSILAQLSATDVHSRAIIPENSLSIPSARSVSLRPKNQSGVSEQDFLKVTSILYRIYAPKILEKASVPLVMNANWNDEVVNAYATREVESWTVHIAGGIARAPGMTKESLALIVCHEIGHHLGGAPRTFLFDGWPAAEGQADYWATSKCLKEYYRELQNEEIVIEGNFPEKALRDCSDIYKSYEETRVCLKTMQASVHFSNFLNFLPDMKTPVSIDSFDPREVKGTNTNNYPRPQCRIDTLYQGALCPIAPEVATSESDAKIGHCNDTSRPGARPRCWYKP